ncbi:MAG: transcriptional regulator [Flavobacteriaceae bacterium]|nr:transcriptional regulator [Flavobacteriaceae bacterium]|tara:strand:+ start:58581 stop:59144 length:564 start_codon:yes stop_codon:yes gene_type:complete
MKIATLSENLVYQRKLKGYTQEDLSEKTTVGVRTIQRIEKGETQPHLQTVKLLAVGLEVEVNDLLPMEDPNEENIERKWMLLLHSISFLGFIIPFGNILFPLFLWIHKADDNSIYDEHGRAIVNFHISMTLYFILSLISFFILPGFNFFLTGAIILFTIIMMLRNISTALNRGRCHYPLAIQFLKSK